MFKNLMIILILLINLVTFGQGTKINPNGYNKFYYENGKIKYESLEYGATSVVFRKFDEEGNLLEEGWVAPVEYYNAVAKETGMDPIEE